MNPKHDSDNFEDKNRKGDQAGLDALAKQHDFSTQAVAVMRNALVQGNGRLAQFDHPEFGGAGQWMQGGMIMIGDMFNNQLKSRVDALCSALSTWLAQQPAASEGHVADQSRPDAGRQDNWWPAGLSPPTTTGQQNAMRYAYFEQDRRLAIDDGGRVMVYDTQDHRISGVSQQQSTSRSLTFSSQHGPIDLASLPVV